MNGGNMVVVAMEWERIVLAGAWISLMLIYLLGDVIRIFAGHVEVGVPHRWARGGGLGVDGRVRDHARSDRHDPRVAARSR